MDGQAAPTSESGGHDQIVMLAGAPNAIPGVAVGRHFDPHVAEFVDEGFRFGQAGGDGQFAVLKQDEQTGDEVFLGHGVVAGVARFGAGAGDDDGEEGAAEGRPTKQVDDWTADTGGVGDEIDSAAQLGAADESADFGGDVRIGHAEREAVEVPDGAADEDIPRGDEVRAAGGDVAVLDDGDGAVVIDLGDVETDEVVGIREGIIGGIEV